MGINDTRLETGPGGLPSPAERRINGALDRVTLRFLDRDLEAAYGADHFPQSRANIRTAHLLGVALWIVWGVLVRSYLGEDRDLDLLIRYGVMIPLLVAGLAFSFTKWYARAWEAEAVVAMLVSSFTWIVYATAIDSMPVDWGYVGVILIMTFGFTLVRLRFPLAVASSTAMVVAYVAVALLWGDLTRQELLIASFYFVSFLALGAIASYMLERSARLLFLRERQLDRERARSDALLLNILPSAIVDRLKARHDDADGGRLAEALDEVTVLFADAVGFTEQAAKTPPDRLVEGLDQLFTRFDALADRFGLEKIKTAGDAYMAVAGAPVPRTDHAAAAAEMALAILEEVQGLAWPSGDRIRLRIGMASGPAVAGVIGQRKFAYDLWGDTVNLASRLESNADPGRILISEGVAARLDGRFAFGPQLVIDLKGKGPTPARCLTGRATEPPAVDAGASPAEGTSSPPR